MSILDSYFQSMQQGQRRSDDLLARRAEEDRRNELMAAREALANRMTENQTLLGPESTPEDIRSYIDPIQQHALKYGDPAAVNIARPSINLGMDVINNRQAQEAAKRAADEKARLQKQKSQEKAALDAQGKKSDIAKNKKFYNTQSRSISNDWTKSDANKIWKGARTNHKLIQNALKNPGKTGVRDSIATILFNKALDPGSVVREGEYDRAAEYGGLLNKLRSTMQKYGKGQTLPPDVREEMIAGTRELARMQLEAADQASRKYKRQYDILAQDSNLPDRVGDYRSMFGDEDPSVLLEQENKNIEKQKSKQIEVKVDRLMREAIRAMASSGEPKPTPEELQKMEANFRSRLGAN